MSTPLFDHGGAIPSKFHTITYNDKQNKVILLIRLEKKIYSVPFMQVLNTCLLNNIEKIFFIFPKTLLLSNPSQSIPNLKRFHPLLQEIITDDSNEKIFEVLSTNFINNTTTNYFYHYLQEDSLIHPNFWKILQEAKNNNYTFLDDTKKEHLLFCKSPEKTIHSDKIGAYSNVYDDFDRIYDNIVCALDKQMKTKVQKMSIDVSNNFTPLCRLAFHYSTDKSVYNLMNHRHPYTPIYHMFFNSYRKKALKIGEVGILNGASIFMWNDYFTHPGKVIHGYDIDPTSLEKIKDIPNSQGFLVDAGSSSGLKASLTKACSEDKELYDILIEDASHHLEHQLIFLRDAISFVKPGGLLVIEDIFREISQSRFEEVLDLISDEITNAILIKPEHFFRHSPGWDNDQILIVFKA